MDQCVNEVTPPSLTNDTDFTEHLGVNVCQRQSGKWVAKIRHPIKKVWVCVGIYNTPKEAADAYAAKKLDYETHSVQETALSFHTNVSDFEKQPGIKRLTSGKWMANIKHKKVQVYLGAYNTPTEAAYAYNLSKLELHSKAGVAHKSNAFTLDSPFGSIHNEVKSTRMCQDGSTSRQECLTQAVEDAREALSGKKCELDFKGGAEQPETEQRRRHAYDTAEAAEGAYNNKMREVDLMLRAHKKPKLSKGSCVSDDPFVFTDGSSVIKAGREEDAAGRMINVNVESGSEFVTEETRELDFGVIDSCGRLVDEYSRMDDELWIRRSEDDAALERGESTF